MISDADAAVCLAALWPESSWFGSTVGKPNDSFVDKWHRSMFACWELKPLPTCFSSSSRMWESSKPCQQVVSLDLKAITWAKDECLCLSSRMTCESLSFEALSFVKTYGQKIFNFILVWNFFCAPYFSVFFTCGIYKIMMYYDILYRFSKRVL